MKVMKKPKQDMERKAAKSAMKAMAKQKAKPLQAMKGAMKAIKDDPATGKIAMKVMKAAKVATGNIATTKPMEVMKKPKQDMEGKAVKSAMKAMAKQKAKPLQAMKAATNPHHREALIAAEKEYRLQRKIITKSIKEEEMVQRRVERARTKRARIAAAARTKRARDVDTTLPPPDDAVWWFCDTRGIKSVWAVAWNYKGKIQQVMYKED